MLHYAPPPGGGGQGGGVGRGGHYAPPPLQAAYWAPAPTPGGMPPQSAAMYGAPGAGWRHVLCGRRGRRPAGQYSMAAAHVLRAHVSLPCQLKITTPATRGHRVTSPAGHATHALDRREHASYSGQATECAPAAWVGTGWPVKHVPG